MKYIFVNQIFLKVKSVYNISLMQLHLQIYILPQVQYHCVNTKQVHTLFILCEYIRIRLTSYGGKLLITELQKITVQLIS